MRKPLCVGIGAVLAGLVLAVAPAGAVTTCEDIRSHSPYRCDFVGADHTHSSLCMFIPLASPAGFAMTFPSANISAFCACEAKGSFLAPQFDQSKVFICLGNNPNLSHFALSGQLVGIHVMKGNVYGPTDGNRLVFQCRPDPTC